MTSIKENEIQLKSGEKRFVHPATADMIVADLRNREGVSKALLVNKRGRRISET